MYACLQLLSKKRQNVNQIKHAFCFIPGSWDGGNMKDQILHFRLDPFGRRVQRKMAKCIFYVLFNWMSYLVWVKIIARKNVWWDTRNSHLVHWFGRNSKNHSKMISQNSKTKIFLWEKLAVLITAYYLWSFSGSFRIQQNLRSSNIYLLMKDKVQDDTLDGTITGLWSSVTFLILGSVTVLWNQFNYIIL